jgi:hypothetical protein
VRLYATSHAFGDVHDEEAAAAPAPMTDAKRDVTYIHHG